MSINIIMTLSYFITETDNNEQISEDKLLEIYNSNSSVTIPSDIASPTEDNREVIYLDYHTNNTIKSLTKIIDYYGLTKKRMTKDEIVLSIVLFEMEEQNREIVQKRKRLWRNIEELKEDSYFSKFILFEP